MIGVIIFKVETTSVNRKELHHIVIDLQSLVKSAIVPEIRGHDDRLHTKCYRCKRAQLKLFVVRPLGFCTSLRNALSIYQASPLFYKR